MFDDLFPPQYQDDSYEYGSWDDIFSRMTTNLSADAAIINQITNYLSTNSSAAINDIIRASSIQQLETDMKMIQNDVSSLQNLFTSNININENVFDSSLNVINRAETIIDTLDRLDNYANDIINHINNSGEFISSIPEKIEESFNKFQNTLDSLINFDVSSTIDKLPDLISDKFINLDIIQDPLILLNNVQNTVSSLSTTIASIKAPQNLNDARALLTTLKGIISQIQNVKSQAERVIDSINRLKDTISSGNFISLLTSLAAGGVTFFERPPSYNARYPFNHGYKTHGGHVFEKDNTPGSERISYTHPSKTSLEIQPDGGVILKGKSDFQLSVSKNCDVYIKNATTITIDGDARIIANNVTAEAKGNATISSNGNVIVNAVSSASVVAGGSVTVSSGGTCTVSSIGGTSISSNGILTLSSNSGINIISDGPITTTAPTLNETITGATIRSNATSMETTAGAHIIRGMPISLN